MKLFIAGLLAAILSGVLPGIALAHPHPPPDHRSPICGPHGHGAGPKGKVSCLAGVVVTLSAAGMKIHPTHGPDQSVRFTVATRFQTDSGQGVLDGIVPGDTVCVAYKPHPVPVIALLVVFDPGPMSCGPKKHHPPPDKPTP